MKKLTRKLFLSVAALAVCAATLVSTTFAWYVSNSEATVSGVTGATAGAATEGNLMVAQVAIAAADGTITESGNWGNKLTSVSASSLPDLSPVTKDDETKNMVPTSNATGWHDVEGLPVAEFDDTNLTTSVAYGYFAFGIWSTEKTKINLDLGVSNTTSGALTTQTLYNTAGQPTAKAATGTPSAKVGLNEAFTMDAVQALRVEILTAPLTGANLLTTDFTSLGVMDAASFLKSDLSAAYATDTTKFATGGDANAYYAAVAGTAPVGGTAAKDEVADIANITLAKNTKTVVLVRYWLEGTDEQCFDSCVAQSFAFNFGFEAVNA